MGPTYTLSAVQPVRSGTTAFVPNVPVTSCSQGMPEIAVIVFPPEPPVARTLRQNGAQPARARAFGAAKRTLPGEHRSGSPQNVDGRRSGGHDPCDSRW